MLSTITLIALLCCVLIHACSFFIERRLRQLREDRDAARQRIAARLRDTEQLNR